MKNLYKAHIYEMQGHKTYFEGEIESVYMKSNVRELQNEPCVFVNDTKEKLLADMIFYLKSSGKTGVLRVVN